MPRVFNKRKVANRRRWKKQQTRRSSNKMKRQVHLFKRTYRLDNIVTTSNATTGIQTPIASAYTVALASLPNASEFGNLFDQYKITGAKFEIAPLTSEGILSPNIGTTNQLGFAPLHTVIDYDDSTPPVSLSQMLEYGSHKQTMAHQKHVRYIKPKVLQEVYRSAVSTGYRPISSQWVDMSYNDVPHYGLKVYAEPPQTTSLASITYSVYCTLYFACKNVR